MKRAETVENAAIAAYFQFLRGAQRGPGGKKKLTQGQLAQQVGEQLGRGVKQYIISRIERGGIPDGDVMAIMLDLLGGRLIDVLYLIRRPNASDFEGRDLAVKALAASQRLRNLPVHIQENIRVLESTEEGRQALIDAAQRHLPHGN